MLDVMMVFAFVAAGPHGMSSTGAILVASDPSISRAERAGSGSKAHAHGKKKNAASERRDDRNPVRPPAAEDFHGSSMPAR
jgi:hypothetical protein